METVTKRLYEGMFLIDSGLAAQDWQVIIDEIQRMMKRAEADVVSLKKWDDRRMIHDIQGKSRGTYILVYFNCDPETVKGIERDVQLSEIVMRVLILRTDKMSPKDIEKATPAETSSAETTPAETSPAETTPAETSPVETAPAAEAKDVDEVTEDSTDDDGDAVDEEIA